MPPGPPPAAVTEGQMRADGSPSASEGATPRNPDDAAGELAREVAAGPPLSLEILRFYMANRYTMLSLEGLAQRLFREPDLVRPALEHLARIGYVRVEGRAPVYVLTDDAAKLKLLDALSERLSAGGSPQALFALQG
jgi:hypothetical protein